MSCAGSTFRSTLAAPSPRRAICESTTWRLPLGAYISPPEACSSNARITSPGALHFDFPTASCQSLLDSLPSALLPALQGTRIAGAFAAHGRFGFDTRSLDDLELDYQVKDQCRVTEVPAELARERFAQPFSHRIYLPDGSIALETTGPGSDNWARLLDEISPYMQVAVLTTEDGGFPKHHGFNRASIRSSIVANLKARRFARGASTITMQLAKNLFLSRDKTILRGSSRRVGAHPTTSACRPSRRTS